VPFAAAYNGFYPACVAASFNKSFKFVPALRASTGPKKAAPFWAA